MQQVAIKVSTVLRMVTPRAQLAKIPRGGERDFIPCQIGSQERRHECASLIEIVFVCEAAQDFYQNQVVHRYRFHTCKRIQPVRLRRGAAPEVVDPDAGIDRNHPSCRIATASHLVFRLVTRKTSSISLSSMAMLVRMVCNLCFQYTHCRGFK
jgi:hypothetical protein